MINLLVVGKLDQCTTFDSPLDNRRVSRIEITDDSTLAFVRENLRVLKERPDARMTYRALQKALRRYHWRRIIVPAVKRRVVGMIGSH